MTSTLPKLTEREFMEQVTQLAELRGWSWAHFRPAQTAKGWRTPVSGPLGKGWPDLVLVRERDRRLLFAELKRDGAKLTPEQGSVMAVLETVQSGALWSDYRHIDPPIRPSVEVWTWRPADWDMVEVCLR